MLIITDEQVTLDKKHRLIAEASDLDLGPGEWPEMIAVTFKHSAEGVLFGPHKKPIEGNPENGFIYFERGGAGELHILND